MPKSADTPPFRADHVGSLLRPEDLTGRARGLEGRRAAGRCPARGGGSLHCRRRRKAGVVGPARGDGRGVSPAYLHYDFVAGLDGSVFTSRRKDLKSKGGVPLTHKLRVNGRIGWSKPVMIDHFRFLAGHVRGAMPKQTIPAPSVVHFRGGRDAIDRAAYPTLEPILHDLGEAYHKAVGAFGAAGCRYLQLDEVNIAYLCDPEQIAALNARGEHVENLLEILMF